MAKVRYLSMLGEQAIREAFIKTCLDPLTELEFDDSPPERQDREFYIGNHRCKPGDNFDDWHIELWASSDGNDYDWLAWYLCEGATDGGVPISWCPFCGLHLSELINDD